MRISEIARSAGVPVAAVKYYLRDGLLHPGTATSATQASYDDTHVRRLRLVRSLVEVGGMPLAKVRLVLEAIDEPAPDPYDAVGTALAAVPPYVTAEPPFTRAETALDAVGLPYEPDSPAVGQLEAALSGLEAAGRPLPVEAVRHYAEDVLRIARREVDDVERGRGQATDGAPSPDGATVEDVVLGTVLVEPVILALRRLAHAALFRAMHRP